MAEAKASAFPVSLLTLTVYLKDLILRLPYSKTKREEVFNVRFLIVKYFIKVLPIQRKAIDIKLFQEISEMYSYYSESGT